MANGIETVAGAFTTAAVAFFAVAVTFQLTKPGGTGSAEVSTVGATATSLGGDAFKG